MRPTSAEIRLAALVGNYRLLARNVEAHAGPGAGLIAVVKANAYGHGVELCGPALADAGAPWLGVTSVAEARVLRNALGPGSKPGASRASDPGATEPGWVKRLLGCRVLIMSGFFPGEEADVVRLGLRPQVWERAHFDLLEEEARRRGNGPGTIPVHLEVDTGMSRQGVAPGGALETLLHATQPGRRYSPVQIEGVLTHFSSPEEREKPVMREQIERFAGALRQLHQAGVRPRWIHAGNSANAGAGLELKALAGLAGELGAGLLVRPGLSLYGVPARFSPAPPADAVSSRLEPVLCWKTRVTALREIAGGTPVGYGEAFRAPHGATTRLALLPVGYADGLRRALGENGAEVLIGGRRAPLAGRISMDQTVVDVSRLPAVQAGDEVVLLGEQDGEQVSAYEMADRCGTIPYEVLCGIASRVPRLPVEPD